VCVQCAHMRLYVCQGQLEAEMYWRGREREGEKGGGSIASGIAT
jgi:hypothetical protein